MDGELTRIKNIFIIKRRINANVFAFRTVGFAMQMFLFYDELKRIYELFKNAIKPNEK